MKKLAMSPAGFAALVSKLLESIEIVDGLPVDTKHHYDYRIPVPASLKMGVSSMFDAVPSYSHSEIRHFVAERIDLGPLGRRSGTTVYAWKER